MMSLASQYPIFGPEIHCPHCRQIIPALLLTDTYLCPRHGAFEADPKTEDLVHVQSSRFWRRWEGEWHRQHTHPDGIRFEIHEALDRLYTEGFSATRVVIAERYRSLITSYFERSLPWRESDQQQPRLYGLPVDFSPSQDGNDRWSVVNFELDTEPGSPARYPYFRLQD
jgi:uncharacterized protein (TIGR02652 family)